MDGKIEIPNGPPVSIGAGCVPRWGGGGPFPAGPPPHGLWRRGGVEDPVRRGLAGLFAAFEVQAGQAAVEEAG